MFTLFILSLSNTTQKEFILRQLGEGRGREVGVHMRIMDSLLY